MSSRLFTPMRTLSYLSVPCPCTRSDFSVADQIRVVGQDGAAIAVAAERLGREEASGGDRRQGADLAAAQSGAEALGGVGDQQQAVGVAKRIQRLVVRRQPEQVNGDQSARLQPLVLRCAQPSLELADVDIEVGGLDVDEHRRRADQCHRLRRGGEGEVGHDHRVALADALGHQGELQSVGAVAASDREARAAECRQLRLEGGDFRSRNENAMVEHPRDRRIDLAGDAPALGGKIDEGNRLSHATISFSFEGISSRRSGPARR